MYTREGTNQAGEDIRLDINEKELSFRVIWYGLCGCYSVEFPFKHEGQAIQFYEAALQAEEYEVN